MVKMRKIILLLLVAYIIMPPKKRSTKGSLDKNPSATNKVVPVAQASGGQPASVAGGSPAEDATIQPLTSGENNSSKACAFGGQPSSANDVPSFAEDATIQPLTSGESAMVNVPFAVATIISAPPVDDDDWLSLNVSSAVPPEDNSCVAAIAVSSCELSSGGTAAIAVSSQDSKSSWKANFHANACSPPHDSLPIPAAMHVFAIKAIVNNALLHGDNETKATEENAMLRVPSPVMTLSEKRYFLLNVANFVKTIFRVVDLTLDERTVGNLVKLFGMKPDSIIPFPTVLDLSKVQMNLSDETLRLITFQIKCKSDNDVSDVLAGIVKTVSLQSALKSANPNVSEMVHHVVRILKSHSNVPERLALLVQVFTMLPLSFLGEKSKQEMNKVLQGVLFDANSALLTSTNDPAVFYDLVVCLLKEAKNLLFEQMNVKIPDLAKDGKHVSTKMIQFHANLIQHKNGFYSRIESLLRMVSLVIRCFKFTIKYVDRFPIMVFLTEQTKSLFELSLFEYQTFLQKNDLPDLFMRLSFEREDVLKLALCAVKINTSCVEHKSLVYGAGTNQLDLATVSRCVFPAGDEDKYKFVLSYEAVGAGKTTTICLATLMNLILRKQTESAASLLCYCGPLHSSNHNDIVAICNGVKGSFDASDKHDVNFRIVPIFNGVVPPSPIDTKKNEKIVYFITGTSINEIHAVLPRFPQNSMCYVIIDDNPTVSSKEVMELVENPSIKKVFVLGSTMDDMVFPGKEEMVLTLVNDKSAHHDIRAIQGCGCIPEISLTMEQMTSAFSCVSEATKFISNRIELLERLILRINQLKYMNDSCSDGLVRMHGTTIIDQCREYLRSLITKKVDAEIDLNKVVVSEEEFFTSFRSFIDSVFSFLMKSTIFPVCTTVMHSNIVDSLKNSNMDFLDYFAKFLHDYKEKMTSVFGDSCILREFPELMHNRLRTQSDVESLSKLVKPLIHHVVDKGLAFCSELMPPRPVPQNERTYNHHHGPTIYVCAQGDDPHKIATAIADCRLQKFQRILTKSEDSSKGDTGHQSRRKHRSAASACDKSENLPTNQGSFQESCLEPSTPQTPQLQRSIQREPELSLKKKDDRDKDEPEMSDVEPEPETPEQIFVQLSIDEKTTTVSFDSVMKYAVSVSDTLSKTAPSPHQPDIRKFVKCIFDSRIPCWKELIRNFVIGSVAMHYEMTPETTTLCLELLCTGRLDPVIQEETFDLTSMNIPYHGDLRLNFMSEVSGNFCRQMIGRCGRVSNTKDQGIGNVMCQTPSGSISLPESEIDTPSGSISLPETVSDEKKSHHQDDEMPRCSIGCFEEFQSRFSIMPTLLMKKLFEFLSSCRMVEKDVSFFRNLLSFFQEVLYNPAFKFCCANNKIEQIMTFLSCALIVISGNDLQNCHVDVDSRLSSLALNQESKMYNYTDRTFTDIKTKFLQAVKGILTLDQLQSVFGFLRVIQDKHFRFQSITDLSRMFLNFQRIGKLSVLMKKFLFNLRFSKDSHDLNASINGLLTILEAFDTVLDQLMLIIMSYSIPCSTLESVKRNLSDHVRTAVTQCSNAQKPFISLKTELMSVHLTRCDLLSCLLRYSDGGCTKCDLALRDFKSVFSCQKSNLPSVNLFGGKINALLDGLKQEFTGANREIKSLELQLTELESLILKNKHTLAGLKLTKANSEPVKKKGVLNEQLEAKRKQISELSTQIQALEIEISPYRGLSEADAVAFFIQRTNQC